MRKGTFSNTEAATTCVVCPRGTFRLVRAAQTAGCSAGQFLADQGVSPVYHDEAEDCSVCPANTYADEKGTYQCTTCDTDYIIQDNGGDASKHVAKSNCTLACAAGKYLSTEGQSCRPCEAGWTCDGGTSNRTRCEAGYFCEGSTHKKGCPPGKYGDKEGQSNEMRACFPCEKGRFQPAMGQPSCDQACPLGKFGKKRRGTSRGDACEGCPVGYKCPRTGMPEPEECGLGAYQDDTGQPDCKPCGYNTYNDNDTKATHQSSCKSCESDKSTTSRGATSELECIDKIFCAQKIP